MKLIDWPCPEVDKKRSPYYEYAYIKAHLEGNHNTEAFRVYQEMFGKRPKKGLSYWFVRLVVYYGALFLGHQRRNRSLNSTETSMLNCLLREDEKALRNNKVLWHYMYLHDVEDEQFGGRELVEEG